jgi:hypothetical protein
VTRSDHDRSGQALALTVLAPITAGRESALADVLNDLAPLEGSPLARVPGTHFARFVVIDAPVYEGAPQKRDSWKASRLLFTSNFDAPLERYLDGLRTGLDADGDAIFGHCAGYPGHADAQAWTAWMLAHRVKSSLFFGAYGDQAVQTVRDNVATRARVIAFALEAQGLAPAELQARFREVFPR